MFFELIKFSDKKQDLLNNRSIEEFLKIFNNVFFAK